MHHLLQRLKGLPLFHSPVLNNDVHYQARRRFGSYPAYLMCIDPKEKEGQGTFHLGRSQACNEARKQAVGVNAALFLAVYRIPPEAD